MPYSITTKDGITINNIPDDVEPDSPSLRQRVASIRAGGGAKEAGPSQKEQADQYAGDDVGQMGMLMRGVGGAKHAWDRAAYGLKGLFTDLTPEEKAQLAQGRAFVEEGGIPAQVGQGAADIAIGAAPGARVAMGLKTAGTLATPILRRALGATAGTVAAGAVPVAGNVAYGAGYGALTEPEDRAAGAQGGALGTAAGMAAGKVLSPVVNRITGKTPNSYGQNRAAVEIGKALDETNYDSPTMLRQTIERLRDAQQRSANPAAPNIPLSTAATLSDAQLARLEAGSRVRNGANWYNFDQDQARSVADALRTATASADDIGARRLLRSSNYTTARNQALSSLNESAFANDVAQLRRNLDVALQSGESSNPAVRNMINELANEIDRLGPNFGPESLATIRANLSGKANSMVAGNAYKSAPRESPATISVLREVDSILNNATGNRWQNAVNSYARDSDAVRAAEAAAKVRSAFYDEATGRVRGVAADAAGDVPKITEAGLGRALDMARGPNKSLVLSLEANGRVEAILDALRAQNIVQGVKRSATAGGGSDTASNQFAAKAAGAAGNALFNGPVGTIANKAVSTVTNALNESRDRALAEALQNPQQMITILQRKLQAGAPLTQAEAYWLSLLQGGARTAAE